MISSEIFGWAAALLTLLAFSQRSMLPLRLAAIGANVAFVTYGLTTGLLPILALHLTLLPCNLFRLAQLVAYEKQRSREAKVPHAVPGPTPAQMRRDAHRDGRELSRSLVATRHHAHAPLHRHEAGRACGDARRLIASVDALERALHPHVARSPPAGRCRSKWLAGARATTLRFRPASAASRYDNAMSRQFGRRTKAAPSGIAGVDEYPDSGMCAKGCLPSIDRVGPIAGPAVGRRPWQAGWSIVMKPFEHRPSGIASGPLGLSTISLRRMIEWGEHYQVGQPELDAQHRAIFDIALEVADIWQRRGDMQQLKEVAAKLARALEAHFAFEERQFADTDYARKAEHCEEHRVLLAELHSIRERLERMKPGRVPTEPGFVVLSYVLGLTVGHLSHSDMDGYAARRVDALRAQAQLP